MNDPILVYKEQGDTPLQTLTQYRDAHPALAGVSITYAGRLDPMAEGLLLLLVGTAVYDKENYLSLDKEYRVDVLVGVHTDTYDVLGLVDTYASMIDTDTMHKQWWQGIAQSYMGPWDQEYPPFASKTVNGVPLFVYARENKLDTITLPRKKVMIQECECVDIAKEEIKQLDTDITTLVQRVTGDFRQEEILKKWHNILAGYQGKYVQKVTLRVVCSSGTYVRSLVHRISKDLGIPLCVYRLLRTKIGDYTLCDIQSD